MAGLVAPLTPAVPAQAATSITHKFYIVYVSHQEISDKNAFISKTYLDGMINQAGAYWSRETNGAIAGFEYDWNDVKTLQVSNAQTIQNNEVLDLFPGVQVTDQSASHIVIVVKQSENFVGSIDSGGISYFSSNPPSLFSGGYIALRVNPASAAVWSAKVLAHEVGHNLGLVLHAGSYKCQDPVYDGSSSNGQCRTVQYEDYFDVMGSNDDTIRYPLSAYRKSKLGLLDGRSRLVIAAPYSNRIALAPLEAADFSRINEVRVIDPLDSTAVYSIEFRSGDVYQGIRILRVIDPNMEPSGVDAAVLTPTSRTGPQGELLYEEESFISASGNVSFIVVSENRNQAVIQLAVTGTVTPLLQISQSVWNSEKNYSSLDVLVTSNTSWSLSAPSWVDAPVFGIGNESLVLALLPNDTGTTRAGTIIFTTTNGSPSVKTMISVTQRSDDCGSSVATYCSWLDLIKPVNGFVEIPGDKDWYRFIPSVSGVWAFIASKPGSEGLYDSCGVLYAADGITPITSDNSSAGNSQFRLSALLTAGQTYFLEVRSGSAGVYTGGYTVTSMSPGLSLFPSISVSPTSWAAPTSGGSLAVQVTSNTSWSVSLPSGVTVVPSFGTGNGVVTLQTRSGTVSRADTIQFLTTSGSPMALASIEFTQDNCESSISRSCSWSDLTKPIGGSIEAAGDKDWFRIVPTATRMWTFTAWKPGLGDLSDSYGTLYTSDGNVITSDDNSAGDSQFRVSAVLTVGVPYFLEVRSVGSGTGGYAVSASSSSSVPLLTVSFNANGGTGSPPPSISTTSDVSITLPTQGSLSRPGYAFAGWNTLANGSGTTYAAGSTQKFSVSVTLYAKWTPSQVTVTFSANGGTGATPPSIVTTANTPLVLPTQGDLSRTGYSFAGWNDKADGSGASYMPGQRLVFITSWTLYAKWTPLPTLTISFNANGGTGTTPASLTTTSDAYVVLPTQGSLVRTGYTFVGWNTLANGSGMTYQGGSLLKVSSSTVLYAVWSPLATLTISFSANGGSGAAPASLTTTSDVNVTLPTQGSLLRTGYSFGGWNTQANGSGTTYTAGSSQKFTASTTLYAKWSPLPTVTIVFNTNGGMGTVPASVATTSDAYVVLPTQGALSRTGYTFAGWNTQANGLGTTYAAGSSQKFSASTTLYAKWTAQQVIITFNANGGTGTVPASVTTTSDATVTLPAQGSLSRTGYTFGGWNTQASGSGSNYPAGSSQIFTASTVLYAKWTPLTAVTIVFNVNGGTGAAPASLTTTSDVNVTLPTQGSLLRTGYSFGGWNTQANGSGTTYAAGSSQRFAISTVLYAKWTPLPTLTISFNANGGTGTTPTSLTTTSDAYVVLPVQGSLVRTGYTFVGWNTQSDGSGTTYAAGSLQRFTSSTTLYAKWTPVPDDCAASASTQCVWSNFSTPVSGSVEVAYDKDWFKIVPTVSGTWTFTASKPASGALSDSYGSLYDANGIMIAWNDDGAGDLQFKVSASLTAGVTYFLEVRAFSGGTGAYTVTATVPTVPSLSVSPGIWWVYPAGGSLVVQVSSNTSWSVSELPSGVTASPSSGSGNGSVTLRAAAGAGQNLDGFIMFSTTTGSPIATTGVAILLDDCGASTSEYCTWSDLTEPISGSIGLLDYSDWYRFVPPTSGIWMLTVSRPVASGFSGSQSATIYKSDGTSVLASGDINGNTQFRVSLTAGVPYFIDVQGSLWSMGPYTVTATPPNSPYTVSFNANGGTGTTRVSLTTTSGASVALPAQGNLIRTGYAFTGWNTQANGLGTTYTAGSSQFFTTSTVLYARWVPLPTLTINFNVNGGTGTAPASVTTTSDVSVTLPMQGSLSRTGYSFSGWNTQANGSGTTYAAGSSQVFAASVTLYARWVPLPTVTVSFNTNGGVGTTPVSMTINSGASIILPTQGTLYRTGYAFGGWNTQANGSGVTYVAGSSQAFTTSTVLYAKWIVVQDDCGASTSAYCTWSNLSVPVSGSIESTADKDWFKIVPTVSGTWTFTASKPSSGALADSYGYLYAENGTTMIISNDDSAGDLQFQMSASLTAGVTYFLQVQGFGYATGGYIVTATPPH